MNSFVLPCRARTLPRVVPLTLTLCCCFLRTRANSCSFLYPSIGRTPEDAQRNNVYKFARIVKIKSGNIGCVYLLIVNERTGLPASAATFGVVPATRLRLEIRVGGRDRAQHWYRRLWQRHKSCGQRHRQTHAAAAAAIHRTTGKRGCEAALWLLLLREGRRSKQFPEQRIGRPCTGSRG